MINFIKSLFGDSSKKIGIVYNRYPFGEIVTYTHVRRNQMGWVGTFMEKGSVGSYPREIVLKKDGTVIGCDSVKSWFPADGWTLADKESFGFLFKA